MPSGSPAALMSSLSGTWTAIVMTNTPGRGRPPRRSRAAASCRAPPGSGDHSRLNGGYLSVSNRK
jgi:hypothetical protein